jgi:hypothetical protein
MLFKKISLYIFLFVVVSSAAIASPVPNVFKNKEEIRFKVFSNGIRIGSGYIIYHGVENLDGQEVQHITFQMSTFSVKDKEEVYGTVDFSAPIRVNRSIRLFGSDEIITETYASDRRSVIISKSVDGAPAKVNTIKSDKELTNVLLLIYKLRNNNKLGEKSAYKINLPTQTFDLHVQKNRKIRVPLGTYESFYLDSTPPKYRIWLAATPDRIPVRIQGLVAGGMMYLAATEIISK